MLMSRLGMEGNDFFLVDVGASGGIEGHWKAFGDKFRAVGFDPLVKEVERLNAVSINPKVRYESAFVLCSDDPCPVSKGQEDKIRFKDNQPFARSSAQFAYKTKSIDFVKEQFNSGQEVKFSDRRVQLDDYFPSSDYDSIDFIKVDTDGHDLPVLLGARKILEKGSVLGLSVEAQFHGPVSDKANLFSNIDAYLRGLGFSLFDLEVYRYSRASLPARFSYSIAANTIAGQALWGEAVYFRDLGDPDYPRMWNYTPKESKVLKLACLFEIFGMPDCAAELIKTFEGRFPSLTNTSEYLDALTPTLQGKNVTYQEYMQAFHDHMELFFPNEQAPFMIAAKPDQKLDGRDYHPSGRPRRKVSPYSVRGIGRKLRALFGK